MKKTSSGKSLAVWIFSSTSGQNELQRSVFSPPRREGVGNKQTIHKDHLSGQIVGMGRPLHSDTINHHTSNHRGVWPRSQSFLLQVSDERITQPQLLIFNPYIGSNNIIPLTENQSHRHIFGTQVRRMKDGTYQQGQEIVDQRS